MLVDPKTGEFLDEYREGAVTIDLDMPSTSPEDPQPESEWLGDWFTKQLARINGERSAEKAAHERRAKELAAREKALYWRWGARLQSVVDGFLIGNKRSMSFAYGKAGFRKGQPRLDVTDEAAAIAWAKEHAPDAVKTSTSLLKSNLPDADVPGTVKVAAVDKFYVKADS